MLAARAVALKYTYYLTTVQRSRSTIKLGCVTRLLCIGLSEVPLGQALNLPEGFQDSGTLVGPILRRDRSATR